MGNLLQNFNRLFMATVLASAAVLWSTLSSAESVGVVYHIDDAKNGRFALHLAEDHLSITRICKLLSSPTRQALIFFSRVPKIKEGDFTSPMYKPCWRKVSIFESVLQPLGFGIFQKVKFSTA
jgi:hypothetical protein